MTFEREYGIPRSTILLRLLQIIRFCSMKAFPIFRRFRAVACPSYARPPLYCKEEVCFSLIFQITEWNQVEISRPVFTNDTIRYMV